LVRSGAGADDGGEDVYDNVLRYIEGDGVMAVFETFFDESERKGGIFCVAGYAFLPRQARKFIKEWKPLFEPYGGFHMKDLVHERNGFANISDTRRDHLLKEAVRIVNQTMQLGVAVSCPLDEIMLHSQEVRAFKHAYPICCYLSMVNLVSLMVDLNLDRDVYYTFEAGHPYESDARNFIDAIVRNHQLKLDFRHAGDAFLPKRGAVPLQAADLLAWEWAKCQDETLEQHLRPLRKSLRALFMRDPKRYRIAHIKGEKLIKWLNAMPGLLREDGVINSAGQTLQ
jgi:hypothetical protein